MAETKTYELLETARKNETALFKRRWREFLSGEDMDEIVRIFAELNTGGEGAIPRTTFEKVNELIYIAQNVKGIDAVLEDFYVA